LCGLSRRRPIQNSHRNPNDHNRYDMKNIRIALVLTLYLFVLQGRGQTKSQQTDSVDKMDLSVYNRLMAMDFNKYVGSYSIERFLSDVGIKYKEATKGIAPPAYLRYMIYSYSDKLWVELQPNEFKHMQNWSPDRKWDTAKFKLETIGAIQFKYNGKCIKCVGNWQGKD
jgi:hypothetical protein